MSYIDILIPLIAGCVMVAFPQLFVKRSQITFDAKSGKFRVIGFVLIGVAGLYFVLKQFSPPTPAATEDVTAWYALTGKGCVQISSLEAGLNTPDDVMTKHQCKEEPSNSGLPRTAYMRLDCEAKFGANGHFIFTKGKQLCTDALAAMPKSN